MSFRRYLEVLAERERGENLPANQVPSTFLFAFAGTRIVGRVSIRHALNPYLERFGGHIGYVVVPEYRRQGYATAILRQALQIARQKLGLTRVLVTCDDDNVGSIRTIEKNGGVLENIVAGPEGATPKRRYWIATADESRDAESLQITHPARDARCSRQPRVMIRSRERRTRRSRRETAKGTLRVNPFKGASK